MESANMDFVQEEEDHKDKSEGRYFYASEEYLNSRSSNLVNLPEAMVKLARLTNQVLYGDHFKPAPVEKKVPKPETVEKEFLKPFLSDEEILQSVPDEEDVLQPATVVQKVVMQAKVQREVLEPVPADEAVPQPLTVERGESWPPKNTPTSTFSITYCNEEGNETTVNIGGPGSRPSTSTQSSEPSVAAKRTGLRLGERMSLNLCNRSERGFSVSLSPFVPPKQKPIRRVKSQAEDIRHTMKTRTRDINAVHPKFRHGDYENSMENSARKKRSSKPEMKGGPSSSRASMSGASQSPEKSSDPQGPKNMGNDEDWISYFKRLGVLEHDSDVGQDVSEPVDKNKSEERDVRSPVSRMGRPRGTKKSTSVQDSDLRNPGRRKTRKELKQESRDRKRQRKSGALTQPDTDSSIPENQTENSELDWDLFALDGVKEYEEMTGVELTSPEKPDQPAPNLQSNNKDGTGSSKYNLLFGSDVELSDDESDQVSSLYDSDSSDSGGVRKILKKSICELEVVSNWSSEYDEESDSDGFPDLDPFDLLLQSKPTTKEISHCTKSQVRSDLPFLGEAICNVEMVSDIGSDDEEAQLSAKNEETRPVKLQPSKNKGTSALKSNMLPIAERLESSEKGTSRARNDSGDCSILMELSPVKCVESIPAEIQNTNRQSSPDSSEVSSPVKSQDPTGKDPTLPEEDEEFEKRFCDLFAKRKAAYESKVARRFAMYEQVLGSGHRVPTIAPALDITKIMKNRNREEDEDLFSLMNISKVNVKKAYMRFDVTLGMTGSDLILEKPFFKYVDGELLPTPVPATFFRPEISNTMDLCREGGSSAFRKITHPQGHILFTHSTKSTDAVQKRADILRRLSAKPENIGKGGDSVFQLTFYHPHNEEAPPYDGRINQILYNIRDKISELAFSIEVFGRTSISSIRERFACMQDCISAVEAKCPVDGPLPPKHLSYYVNPRWLLILEDTIFCDLSIPSSKVGAQEMLRFFMQNPDTSRTVPTKIKDGSTCYLEDLKIRFGYPYLYLHQDGCEHVVVFNQARILTQRKANAVPEVFPSYLNVPDPEPIYCQADNMHLASWVVTDCEILPVSPYYFCTSCAQLFLFPLKKTGKQLKPTRVDCGFHIHQFVQYVAQLPYHLTAKPKPDRKILPP